MAICKCGGKMKPATSMSTNKTLDYQECSACGRVGYFKLYEDGVFRCNGDDARRLYLSLA